MLINDNKALDYLPVNFISEESWKVLLKNGFPKSFGPGENILLQDSPSSGLVCVIKGKIKASIVYYDGTEKIFNLMDAPALVGEAAAFDEGLNICNVKALTNVETVCLSPAKVQEIVIQHPEISRYLINSIATKLRLFALQVKDMSKYSIARRIARILCNFKEYIFYIHSPDDKDCISITHEELASYIGTARPIVTSCLNDFAQKGFLKIKRGKIIILDHEALKIIAEE